ncbi:aldo/keto reductase [Streptomyces sp. L7]
MHTEVESSLRQLGTDRIDVYYVHFWDFMTRPDEVMRGLDDLVRAGKILYPAFSDTPAWVIAQANTLADLRGWSPAVAIQVEYSLLERTAERELFPMAQALDLAIVPWRVLSGGRLAGPGVTNLSGDVRPPDRQGVGRHQRDERRRSRDGTLAGRCRVGLGALADRSGDRSCRSWGHAPRSSLPSTSAPWGSSCPGSTSTG